MTGNFEVSDQDVQDLVAAIEKTEHENGLHSSIYRNDELVARLNVIKERLLKVEVNEF